MTSHIVAAGSKIATGIGLLAVMMTCSALVGYVVARKFGRTRPARKAVFSVVAGAGLLVCAFTVPTLFR